ncbi:hypothetical protein BJ138DRAFT_1118101 [Hygrophoropsis aurantiaca]|uniref:Uncharacterized protein n=1 Tax=Hygrophoropsis aurantiaca TaxID=72124 RepID=A0ACB7ZYX1_9AGAM|nr:hypothetical protein BJ138DRAFT_1118101 [Hygrophoropsis aurantiaca]
MKPKALKPATRAVLQRGLFTGICFDIKFFASSRPREPIYAYRAILDSGLLQLCSDHSVHDNANASSTSTQTIDDVMQRYEWDSEISFDHYETDSDFDEIEIEERGGGDPDSLNEKHKQQPNDAVVEEAPLAYSSSHSAVCTIRVNGVALKTLKALIYHCYTTEIFFSPLKSAVAEKDQKLDPDRIYCSPKSMYRLADKIGSTKLKKLALQSIRSSLSKNNVVHEIFSPFTSRYPEVLKIELDVLVLHLDDSEVFQALSDKLVVVSSGGIPYSHEILIDLMRRLGDLTQPRAPPSVPPIWDQKPEDLMKAETGALAAVAESEAISAVADTGASNAIAETEASNAITETEATTAVAETEETAAEAETEATTSVARKKGKAGGRGGAKKKK